MNWLRNKSITILFYGIFILLLIPWIQSVLNIAYEKPLSGAIKEPVETEFTFTGWFSGEFQSKHEEYINESFGFRNFFVRLNNQLAFNLFNKAKANGVIVGKDNYLYELNYLLAYSGKDFIGEDSIRQNIERLKFIQEELGKRNKTVLLVLAPGKASFYPEFIPDEYLQTDSPTNYKIYAKLSNDFGINTIDFNSYFISQKESSEYPLYPKGGIHWSHYGMCMALDSIVHRLEKLRNENLTEIYWDNVRMDLPNEVDNDIANGMNLLFTPCKDSMAYPEIIIKEEDVAVRPSAVVIGDSFYWDMYNLTPRVFNENHHFWYYNKEGFPPEAGSPVNVDNLNFQQELEQHDIFMILCTEANLSRLGWGFIDRAYEALKDGSANEVPDFAKKVEETKNYIRSDKKWMEVIVQKAKDQGISADSMLTLDAIWVVNEQNK